jgi:hypothetical protein
MTNQERLDLMIDGINMLKNLGLEPTGLKMNSDLLIKLLPVSVCKEIFIPDDMGCIDSKRDNGRYRYEILGIPIEPDFGKNEIKAVKKVGVE